MELYIDKKIEEMNKQELFEYINEIKSVIQMRKHNKNKCGELDISKWDNELKKAEELLDVLEVDKE